MTWEWSHTQEAYTTLRARLYRMPHEVLAVIWGEWKAEEGGHFRPGKLHGGTGGFDERRFERGRCSALLTMSVRDLAERIFDLAERQSDCTNGGWMAHVCPYGCGPHLVAWSSERKIRNGDTPSDCTRCGRHIECESHCYELEDLPDEGVFCKVDCAQEYECEMANQEICG